jgi:hypothetical protein
MEAVMPSFVIHVDDRLTEVIGDKVERALVRPVSLTPDRLLQLAQPVATLKLDGVRVACAVTPEVGVEYRLCGRVTPMDLVGTSDSGPVTLFDCERREGRVFIFDVLVAAGADVRHLSLAERLAAGNGKAPEEFQWKPYMLTTEGSCCSEVVQRALQLSAASGTSDGVILLDADAPYWTQPLKFKEVLTSDFVLERHQGHFRLLTEKKRGILVPWRFPGGRVATVRSVAALSAESTAGISDGVVIECQLSPNGSEFEVKCLRPDRVRANNYHVVNENVWLQTSGFTNPRWLVDFLAQQCLEARLNLERQREVLLSRMYEAGTEGVLELRQSSDGPQMEVPAQGNQLAPVEVSGLLFIQNSHRIPGILLERLIGRFHNCLSVGFLLPQSATAVTVPLPRRWKAQRVGPGAELWTPQRKPSSST